MSRVHSGLIMAVMLTACTAPHGIQRSAVDGISQQFSVQSIIGRVEFPSERLTQATPAQVITQATISLIDQGGTTVGSGITDGSGNFTLNPGAFSPPTGSTYVLEAVKGLQAQLPGANAPRFRTMLLWNGSAWLSITNDSAGGPLVINALTTAVAIASGLDPADVTRRETVGKVNSVAGALNTGTNALGESLSYANITDPQILALRNDITNYLTADLDPVSVVNSIRPTIAVGGVSPTIGYARDVVSITGTGFSPGGTSVSFNGTTAPLLSVTSTRILCTVPVGATSGNLVVTTTRGGSTAGVPFSVPNGSAVVIENINPNPVRTRGTITITGRGFSSTPASNAVSLGGVAGTVSVASPTSLVVNVPVSTLSGTVTVTTGGATSNGYFLTVLSDVDITEIFPNQATRYDRFYLYGRNFGGGEGLVTVGNEKAIVRNWRSNWIEAYVPHTAPAGAQTVRVTTADNQTVTAGLTVLTGNSIGSFVSIGTVPSNGGNSTGVAWTHKWLYVLGGGGNTNIARIPLNDSTDDGAILPASTTNVGNLPFGVSTNDIGYHVFGWAGSTKFWTAGNNIANKAFIGVDENTGAYRGNWDVTAVNHGPAVGDSGCYSTDKALYLLTGADSGGVGTTAAYALVAKDGTLGPWVNRNNLPNLPSGDAYAYVIGNTLWCVAYNAMYATPLEMDGSISTVGWTNYGKTFSGTYAGKPIQVGDWLYMLGDWTSSTNIRRAPIRDGHLQPSFSDLAASSVSLSDTAGTIVIGGYLYVIGGYGNTNIYRAQILN